MTVCPDQRIDDDKLSDYITENDEKFQNESDKTRFVEFVNRLSKISYETMDTFPLDDDFGLKPDQYLGLMHRLKREFNPEISSGTSNKLFMMSTITENGICDAVISKIAIYSSFDYWKNGLWEVYKPNVTVVVHPLDGEIYAQLTNLSTSYKVFFHGAMESPDISRQIYSFPETDYTTVEFLALEIITSPEAKSLSITQRKCRLDTEAETLKTSPIYSFNLCRSECRFRMAIKECGCIPYFYRSIDKKGNKYKICDPEGMRCLGKIKGKVNSFSMISKKN